MSEKPCGQTWLLSQGWVVLLLRFGSQPELFESMLNSTRIEVALDENCQQMSPDNVVVPGGKEVVPRSVLTAENPPLWVTCCSSCDFQALVAVQLPWLLTVA